MFRNVFALDNEYFRLKIKDLLEARDLYHVHFMHKSNVFATAVGLYRIRKTDPWPDKRGLLHQRKTKIPKKSKTLENSEIRYYSWPCILVFVKEWIRADQFGWRKKQSSDDMIPDIVYMPDGRKIPICVIRIEPSEPKAAPAGNFVFPRNVIGGGFPVLVDVQEQEHVASIGCLVTDGHLIYALTNRHVCGNPGQIIYSIFGGNKVPIGRSSPKQVSRKLFTEVYPAWPGRDVFVNLDVGLVEIDDVNYWTSEVYGIGKFKKMEDLSCENISLKLIGAPVRAYGCATRMMKGEIQAMFYRYKSEGGFEYVADFLIGPRKGEDREFSTHRGDSGTIWFMDKPKDTFDLTWPRKRVHSRSPKGFMDKSKDTFDLTPIAVQWGGQVFAGFGRDGRTPYALATCLSTVCNILEVDIVTTWADDLPEYWGALGHFSIATLAGEALRNPNLKELLTANLERISFQLDDLSPKAVSGLSKNDFVPLADVPDLVWKMGPHKRREADENPNHFADMDKLEPGTGKTLLDICKDRSKINVPEWKRYYKAIKDESSGILPFRIQQIFRKMADYVREGRKDEFVCAAGILSHYVGDACQPLHISFRYDGDPDGDKEMREVYDRKERKKVEKKVPVSKGVHADFDKVMVEYQFKDISDNLPGLIRNTAPQTLPGISSSREAATAAVELMERTFGLVDPKIVCRVYAQLLGLKPKERSAELWKRFGDNMKAVIADGAITLAALWESAWKEGNGDQTISDLKAVKKEVLRDIYIQKDFLRSCNINTIEKELD